MAPARPTVYRWVQVASVAAGKLLTRLDAQSRSWCWLVASMRSSSTAAPCWWALNRRARSGCWARRSESCGARPGPRKTAGLGRPAARHRRCGGAATSSIAQAQEQRRRQGQDFLDSTLDAFHTKHATRQALTIDWNAVERDWEAFDNAEDQL